MADLIAVSDVNKPYSFEGHLAILTETVVLTGTIAAAINSQVTAGYIILAYATVTGSYTAVSPDMEVIIYASGGAFKGRLRVVNSTISAVILPVNEFSAGRVNVIVGDTFAVVNNYRLRDRLVEPSEQFRKDSRIDVGTYTTDFRPKANAGGPYVNWIADSAAAAFSSLYSQLVDPASSTALTVAWTFPAAASPNTSTSTTPTIDFTGCSAGTYIGKLVVTDPDNGTSDTVHFPIVLYDDTHLPLDITDPQFSNSDTNGWGLTFTLPAGADLTTLPDGALVIYWEDEYYSGVKASYGSRHASRSNIKFVGYLLRDRTRRTPQAETLTLEAVSPLQILDQLDNVSGVMTETSGTVDSWFLFRSLNLQIAEDALARWGTTLFALHDFYYGADTYDYPELFIPAQTAKGKITELARAIDCMFTCDRQGNFWIEKNSSMETGDRSLIPTRMTLGEDEIAEIEVVREHRTTVNLVEASGFSTDAAPLFSRAPGYAPREGAQKLMNERLVVLQPNAQINLNVRCGLWDARSNKLYNGLPTRTVRATLRGGFDVFDAAFQHEWIVLDGITLAKRGITLTSTRTTLRGIEMSYRQESLPSGRRIWHKVPVLLLDEETTNVPGQTYTPPSVSLPPYTPPTYTPPPLATPLFPGMIAASEQDMAAICVNGVAFASNFNSASPFWVFYNWSAFSTAVTGTVLAWVPDGFNPGSGWVITSTKLYYVTLLTLTATLKHTFAAASSFRTADASFYENGFMAVNSYYPSGGGTKALHTTDNISFTETVVNAYDGASFLFISCYVSSKTAGRIVVAAQTGATTSAAYVSNDHGATWAALSPAFHASGFGFLHIHAPWNANGSDNIYYYTTLTTGPVNNEAMRRQIGATITDVSPIIGGHKFSAAVSRDGVSSYVGNRQRVLLAGEDDTGSFSDCRLFLSNDAGDNWTTLLSDANLRRCALAGDSGNVGWVWGVGIFQQVTISSTTATLTDKMGNLASLTPGEIIAIAGV